MNLNEAETDFESELLEVAEPGPDAEEQRDRNTHYLLTAWKDLLNSRKKEKVKAAARNSGS